MLCYKYSHTKTIIIYHVEFRGKFVYLLAHYHKQIGSFNLVILPLVCFNLLFVQLMTPTKPDSPFFLLD